MASEVAYYTYMYAKVEKSKYQQVTGHARAGILSGRFIAGVLAQILISFKLMNVRELNYISFGCKYINSTQLESYVKFYFSYQLNVYHFLLQFFYHLLGQVCISILKQITKKLIQI